jgi:hypothetical protein
MPTAAYVLGPGMADCFGYQATGLASDTLGTTPARLSTNASSTVCRITVSYSQPRNARSRSVVMMHCSVILGCDLGRNRRDTEAPCEPEAELASLLTGNTNDLAARDLDATGDGERIPSPGDIEDGDLGGLVIARMVVF